MEEIKNGVISEEALDEITGELNLTFLKKLNLSLHQPCSWLE